MSKIIDFLNECGVFFILTIHENAPAGRPFGAVMGYQNDLYVYMYPLRITKKFIIN